MIQKCMKSGGSVLFLFKNEYPRETGEIIHDDQNIFGTTI
jgi:hypothetical protein